MIVNSKIVLKISSLESCPQAAKFKKQQYLGIFVEYGTLSVSIHLQLIQHVLKHFQSTFRNMIQSVAVSHF